MTRQWARRAHIDQKLALIAMLALAGIAALAVWSGTRPRERELLTSIYSPTFANVPPAASLVDTARQLRNDLTAPEGQAFTRHIIPDQAGAIWISILIALLVAFDFAHLRAARNYDLAIALVLGAVLYDHMRFFRITLTPASWRLLDLVYWAIVLLNLALLVRALRRAARPVADAAWSPNVRGRALAAVAIALVACNVAAALAREPDDAGYFTNLGAQRLRERGKLPYGDPLLTGTPGAAYGPLLYAAHLPFQFLIEPHSPNRISPSRPPLGDAAAYVLPPPMATKLCAIAFHLLAVFALFVAARQLTGSGEVGWALIALYCGSAFVIGVGGDTEFITGMTFISHIAPTAATLAAFACLPLPFGAGVLLAVATGIGFYPAFMVPAWAGYFWRDRASMVRFVGGFALAAAIIGGGTLALSRPADGRGRIGTVLHDTLGHHTDPKGYGRSPFGFWGQRTGARRWLMTPTIGESGLTTPAYFVMFAMIGASFFIARRATASQLALLSAAIAIGFSLLKIQPTGTYVIWAYPLLLIGLFADAGSARAAAAQSMSRARESVAGR